MRRFLLAVAALIMADFALSGTTHPVYYFYDSCAAQNQSFVAMVECGRAKRLAECVPNNDCSPDDTAFVKHADALALSVKNKEMSETEALRHFADYKSQLYSGVRRNSAILAASAAASGPQTCLIDANGC